MIVRGMGTRASRARMALFLLCAGVLVGALVMGAYAVAQVIEMVAASVANGAGG